MTSEIKLGTLVSLHNVKVNPKDFDEIVEHYSIPAWNSLESELVQSSDIESSKILLPDEEHILVSCLNPSTHKVWRVGKNNSKVKRLASTEWAVVIPHNTKEIDFINSALEGFHFQFQMNAYVTGTTNSHQRVKKPDFLHLTIPHPKKNIRDKTGNLHSRLRRKSVTNKRITEYCLDYISYLFRSWFIDFDPVIAKSEGKLPYGMDDETAALFPNSFEISELGKIPAGWKVKSLLEVSNLYDNLRVPLSSMERNERKGNYPYHGATSVMDYVDDFIFDGVHLLIAEDGSVVNEDGYPVLQYVWGKFWVNNHAHVLQGKDDVTTEHLHQYVKHFYIQPFVTGAVQLKINQKALHNVKLVTAPPNINNAFNKIIQSLYRSIRENKMENEILTLTRDALLPRLMSGELKVN